MCDQNGEVQIRVRAVSRAVQGGEGGAAAVGGGVLALDGGLDGGGGQWIEADA